MTVYQGTNMYSTWGRYGPKDSVFGVSSSGWFDRISFNKFFDEVREPIEENKFYKNY
jgi:hypothetical protein